MSSSSRIDTWDTSFLTGTNRHQGEKRGLPPSGRNLFLPPFSLLKPQQRVLFLAAAQHHHRFTRQLVGRQTCVNAIDAPIVDIRATLLDRAPRFAFALGKSRLDQGIENGQASVVRQARAR